MSEEYDAEIWIKVPADDQTTWWFVPLAKINDGPMKEDVGWLPDSPALPAVARLLAEHGDDLVNAMRIIRERHAADLEWFDNDALVMLDALLAALDPEVGR